MSDDDTIKEAREEFQYAFDSEADNRDASLEDLEFSRLGKQWHDADLKKREDENRPCLTINKMNAFIRQVVNDARQNKPSIHVHPVDSGADKETADVLNDLIRNIEYTSSADVAYDTATEYAVCMGFGYLRIGMDYAHGDTFDMDLSIDRVSNPFSIYRDQMSTAADSSDWNSAFVTQILGKEQFEKEYKDAAKVDWDAEGYSALADPWCSEDSVMVAEWWKREEYEKQIHLLSDGTIQSDGQMKALQDLLFAQGITVKSSRMSKCYRVKQITMTGAEVIKTVDWPGQYIPIVPVYGDEVDVAGKRHFRSLIRDAKDAQRMFNYWRSMATELVALAPKTPFIGPRGAFVTDAAKWATANVASHSFIEYDLTPGGPPQRQPFVGVPAGALQEALNASDDMKAIIGIYDASLGARSNETSGRAIMARQREGDVATFHFQDNMARAIRHAGRILIDLIPHVYDHPRMVRVIGEDKSQRAVQINQPTPVMDQNGQPQMQPDPSGATQTDPRTGQPVLDQRTGQPVPVMVPMTRIYDLTAGKYDLTVSTGPSFTTRREEAAASMTDMIRAFPDSAPIVGPHLAENLDWPNADKIAEDLKKLSPVAQKQGGIPPEIQQQIDEGMKRLQQLEQENAALKADQAGKAAELQMKAQESQASGQIKTQEMAIKAQEMQARTQETQSSMALKAKELQIKEQELQTKQFEAETDRLRLEHEMRQPPEPPVMSNATIQ